MAPFAFGFGWGTRFVVWLSSPAQPVIFPVTWTASWTTFLLVGWVAWRRRRVNPLRAIFVGAAIPFGATGSFEIVYQFIGAQVQPWGFGMSEIQWVGIVLWALPGATCVAYWRITAAYWPILAAEIAGFVVWAVVGYPQVTWGPPLEEPVAYFLNIGLKLGAFVLLALPTLKGLWTLPDGAASPGRTTSFQVTGSGGNEDPRSVNQSSP